jgi:hypothetical protein
MNFDDNQVDITDGFAVWRRFTRHIYFVGVNDEYCTPESLKLLPWKREIDASKCPLEWSPKVQSYYRYEYKSTSMCKVTFEQIIDEMIMDHQKNKAKHEAYLKTSEREINKIIEERMRTQMDEGVQTGDSWAIKHAIIEATENVGLKIRLLFELYDYPISLMPNFMDWLAKRIRGTRDEELQLLIFMGEFRTEASDDVMSYVRDCYKRSLDVTHTISSRLNSFVEEHRSVFDAIKNILMIVSVFKATTSLISAFTTKKEVEIPFITEDASGEKGKGKKNNKPPKRGKQSAKGGWYVVGDNIGHSESFKTEGGYDVNSNDMMRNVFRRNMYEFFMPGKEKRAGFVIFIKNRVFLMPMHYHTISKRNLESGKYVKGSLLNFVKCGTKNSIQMPIETFLKICAPPSEDDDFCVCEAGVEFPLHKDITSYFVPTKSYEKEFDRQGALLLPQKGIEFEKTNCSFDLLEGIEHGNDFDDFLNTTSIVYKIDTEVGDCGAPFFLRNAAMPEGRLMGIHVSGTSNGTGMSVVVTRESLLEACALIDSVKVTNHDYNFQNQGEFPEYFDGVYPIGRSLNMVRNPTKTKIIPSVLTGIFGSTTTKPARLAREYDEEGNLSFDPFMNGLKKHLRIRPIVQDEIVDACGDHLLNSLINSSKSNLEVDGKVLTFEQAILGIPTLPYCDSIPRNTSSGYPYAMPGGLCGSNPGKTVFFGSDPEYNLNTPACIDLRIKNLERLENLKQGIRNECIYMDFAKDERRPIAKVDEGKTRMINACPLDHLIEVRQYFMSFAMWIQRNRISNGICVGINPYSDEWDQLAKTLRSKGPDVDAGDFSEFDYSEMAKFLWKILGIICRWYTLNGGSREDNKVRHTLWWEVVNSVHINGSYIYHLIASLPSGHPLTVIINSLYVQLVFRYAWIRLHNLDLNSLSHFNDHLVVQSYGDDNVHNKSRYAAMIMNESRLIEIFKDIGLKYTNEKKDNDHRGARTLCDVSFLKREFRFDSYLKKHVAPLSLDTVLEFVYWTKSGAQQETITKQNVDNCIMELSLHTDEIFNRYSSVLLANSFKTLRYFPPLTDRIQLLNKTRHIEEIW